MTKEKWMTVNGWPFLAIHITKEKWMAVLVIHLFF